MPNRMGPQGVSGQEVQRGGPRMDDQPQHFSGADRSGNWMGGCQGQPMMMAPEQGMGQGLGAMQPMGAGAQQGQQMPMQQGQAMAMQPAGMGGPQSMGPSQQGQPPAPQMMQLAFVSQGAIHYIYIYIYIYNIYIYTHNNNNNNNNNNDNVIIVIYTTLNIYTYIYIYITCNIA